MAEAIGIDIESILRKIDRKTTPRAGPTQCKLWTGAKRNNGHYGYMTNKCCNYENQPKFISIHRLVYLLHHLDQFHGFSQPYFNAQGHILSKMDLSIYQSMCTVNQLAMREQRVVRYMNFTG